MVNDIQIKQKSMSPSKMSGKYRFVFAKSVLLLFWQFTFTALSIYLSFSTLWPIWMLGQLLLGINMLQWFFILHDLAHQSLFKSQAINAIIGHIASIICLVPYYPWLYIHNAHHKWTGWKEKDPTIPDIKVEQLTGFQKRLIDLCWKYWIPIFAVNYTSQTFFNIKKLLDLFPKKETKIKNSFSIFWIIMVFVTLTFVLGPWLFLKLWALSFFIYISISDPLLISQHTHLDYNDLDKQNLRPVPFIDQPIFTRSVKYPRFIEQFLFYNFPKHGLHHQFPWVPIYHLPKLQEPKENTIFWTDWLAIAKTMPGHILIFKSTKDSGVKL
ncbi:MAG: fatty acid desaturase [Saprospiraceae bacterium]